MRDKTSAGRIKGEAYVIDVVPALLAEWNQVVHRELVWIDPGAYERP